MISHHEEVNVPHIKVVGKWVGDIDISEIYFRLGTVDEFNESDCTTHRHFTSSKCPPGVNSCRGWSHR